MTTLRELIEDKELTGEWVDWEAYVYTGKRHSIHGDFIRSVDEPNLDAEVDSWELMDEEDYNQSVYANTSVKADFAEWYDDSDARVLVVVLKPRQAWCEWTVSDGEDDLRELTDVTDLDEAIMDSIMTFNALSAHDQRDVSDMYVALGTIEPELGNDGFFDNFIEYRDLSTFAKRLAAMVDVKGLTQKAAAEVIGVPLRTIENWLGGVNTPTQITQEAALQKLALHK